MPFERWQAAVRPKVQGSQNLHDHFGDSLDFFVMLSSATGIVGNTSQANYTAGNTFQDALAQFRAAHDLPAVSLDLGMFKSVGYVAETKGVVERLIKAGHKQLEEEEVLRLIEAAIRNPKRGQSNSQILTGLAPFSEDEGISWRQELRFKGLEQNQASYATGKTRSKDSDDFKELIDSVSSFTEAVDVITVAIIKKLSRMFMVPEEEFDRLMPLSKYGVDSLVAVELRNWLVSRAQADTSIFDILQSPSLSALAEKVATKSRHLSNAGYVAPDVLMDLDMRFLA
jgi:hypothetical protein